MEKNKPKSTQIIPGIFRRLSLTEGFWTFIAANINDPPEDSLEHVEVWGGLPLPILKWQAALKLASQMQYEMEFGPFQVTDNPLYYKSFAVFERKVPRDGFSTYFPGYIHKNGAFFYPSVKLVDEEVEVFFENKKKDWVKVRKIAEKSQYQFEEG